MRGQECFVFIINCDIFFEQTIHDFRSLFFEIVNIQDFLNNNSGFEDSGILWEPWFQLQRF